MKGDRVEVVVDSGDSIRVYDVRATRAGRRVEVTTGRGIVEVTEVTRGGTPVRTARFMTGRVIALVEHPAEPASVVRLASVARTHDPRRTRRTLMGVSLSKGGNVSLTKQAGAAGLTAVTVGLGWDIRTTTGTDFDLDASALGVRTDGKVASDQHFVFYGNLVSPDGTIEHTGDNRTGEGEGDDEQIKVNLASVPAEVHK